MTPAAEELAQRLGLSPHPEGGYYKETYRSAARAGDRDLCTAIYFLLPEGERSLLHRIKSDELWHFHLGGPLELSQILPGGKVETVVLGSGVAKGERLQHAVPAGAWFGAAPRAGSGYSLVGCTVAPGFDFADFELGERAKLVAEFPDARAVIERLTKGEPACPGCGSAKLAYDGSCGGELAKCMDCGYMASSRELNDGA